MRKAADQTMQVVVFELAGQTYGMDINNVLEIIRPEAVTQVPGTPDFIEGVIKLRGQVILVIDLAKRFGLARPGRVSEHSKIIIVEAGGTTVGMVVDGVSEVLRFSGSQIKPPPEIVTSRATAYLQGIVLIDEQLIILLDAHRILYEREKEALEEAAAAAGI
ncbi:MAG: chemotaxis protein CheW [Bacillota bacterium]